jgi:hypothetical protein
MWCAAFVFYIVFKIFSAFSTALRAGELPVCMALLFYQPNRRRDLCAPSRLGANIATRLASRGADEVCRLPERFLLLAARRSSHPDPPGC